MKYRKETATVSARIYPSTHARITKLAKTQRRTVAEIIDQFSKVEAV